MNAVISAEGLTAGYGGPVMRNLTFSVKSGEILVLIGPNGGGKSTLLKTLAGELKSLGGKVLLCGEDIGRLSPNARAKRLSVLLTNPLRPGMMTCREVVETGRHPYTGPFGRLTATDRKAVDRAVALTGVGDYIERDFSAVSDGQRQRVLLARAICQEPDALLLDEPTSYLDIRHKVLFLETLRSLAHENGLAVALSMHEPELAAKIADHVLCVREGKIFRAGRPEDIFREEVLRKLYDIPEELYNKYFIQERN